MMKTRITACGILAALFLFVLPVCTAAQGTEFTYQGLLKSGGVNVNSPHDFEFALFDAASGGAQIGVTLTRSSVDVTEGLFSVKLDFGNQFPGAGRYLEIRVRQTGIGGGFQQLLPRQQINSSPYSVKSLAADNAANATNADSAASASNALQLGGVAANQYVLTGDARLTNARTPTAGSANYIQNQNSGPQSSSNFNISGNGIVGGNIGINTPSPTERLHVTGNGLFTGTLSANGINTTSLFNLNGQRILGVGGSGNTNLSVGLLTGSTSNGNFNAYFGTSSGGQNTTGYQNSFYGAQSGFSNTTGYQNAFFGTSAGLANTTAFNNAFFGDSSGSSTNTGSQNSFFGRSAGGSNTSGGSNVFIGTFAGSANATGSGNVVVGAFSGMTNFGGSGNTLLGYGANTAGVLSNSTAIGTGAQVSQNNAIVLGAINGINGAISDTAVAIGNTSNTFIGSPARFTVVQNTSGQWTQHIGTNGASSGGSFGLLIDAGTTSSDFPFRIRSQGAASEIFSIRGDGNVGIGVGNANTHLHLRANAPTGFAIQMENMSTGKRLYIGNYGTTGAGNHWPGLDSANSSFLYSENNLVFTTPGGIYFSGSTAAEHMRISANGNVGIGTTSPTEKLQVNGNAVFNGNVRVSSLDFTFLPGGGGTPLCSLGPYPTQVAFCSSSMRYKGNIHSYSHGLDIIQNLRPVSFDWKSNRSRDLGLIAEDVERIDPLLVTYRDGRVEGVKYDRIGVVLINAVKEQQAQIESQKKEIQVLRAAICELKPTSTACRKKAK